MDRIHEKVKGGVSCGEKDWHMKTNIPNKVTCERCLKIMRRR